MNNWTQFAQKHYFNFNTARDEAVLWGSAAVAAGLRHQQLAQMSAATVAQNQERGGIFIVPHLL